MNSKDDKLANTVLDIVRMANLLERIGGKYAGKGGLPSVYQYMLLSILSNQGDLSLREIRENTLVTKQAITGLIERMKKSDYIETYTDPSDRRITRVHITKKGNDALNQILPHRVTGNRQAFSILDEEEINQLHTILPKFIHHVEKLLKE
ncbi:MarR family winged helix-turn-helix transcriptional regulator [Oceanobacillus neutriphilus]|uniref:HTH marR-type domain-containing protein n=1 Tax=Oceanobacillus neutriphilus TaxID=531815 RepID=A0ABQ2NQ73_9BACI|nr:MarR family transcriptional regulator [Oceanobacillus neutriphilus]GGP09056.1 hypothetical protein GCM10011346_11580 [Oceanobacillus neutriphilus]